MFTLKAIGVKDGIKATLTWTEEFPSVVIDSTEIPLSNRANEDWQECILNLMVKRTCRIGEYFPCVRLT